MLARADRYSWSLTIALSEFIALYGITRIYDEFLYSEQSGSLISHTELYTTSPRLQQNKSATMKTPLSLLFTTLLLFVLPTFAQFQFFEQMFNQGGQQQQQAQNAASDSSWYKQQYEAGMSLQQACYANIWLTRHVQQYTATNTSVPLPYHVYISPTTVLVATPKSRTRSSWTMEVWCAYQKEVTKLARLQGRLSWQERPCCKIKAYFPYLYSSNTSSVTSHASLCAEA